MLNNNSIALRHHPDWLQYVGRKEVEHNQSDFQDLVTANLNKSSSSFPVEFISWSDLLSGVEKGKENDNVNSLIGIMGELVVLF